MPIRLKLPKPAKQWRYTISREDLLKFKKSGFKVVSEKSHDRLVVTKQKPSWEQFEDEVFLLFKYGLALRDVQGGPAFRIAGYQLDVVGGIEDTLLVVECKSKMEPKRRSLRSDLRSFWVKRRSIANSLRRLFGGSYKRTIFIMVLRGIIPSQKDLAFAKKKKILIWSESYLESIRSLYFTIGDRAKYYILRELGGAPPLVPGGSGRHFLFPALEARIRGNDKLYSTFIPARILLDVAYVLRIESGQKRAYQRFLDKNRLFKIAKFIEDRNSFKNSVVLALDERSRFTPHRPRWTSRTSSQSTVGVLRIPRQFAYAWVIDGQHRLYGFARAHEESLDCPLPVVALQSKSRTEEAKTFLDINSKQKPVDPSLLWVLFGTLNRHDIRGLVSEFVSDLAAKPRSLFRDKIFVPGESKQSRKHYRIFHSNLCDTISEHFVEGRPKAFPLLSATALKGSRRVRALKRAFKIINAYLKWLCRQAVRSHHNRWIRDFFFTNNGLNVVLRVLVHILKYTDGNIEARDIEALFGKAMSEYLSEQGHRIDELRRVASSEGTRETIALAIIRSLAKQTKGFAETYIQQHQRNREEEEPYKLLRKLENDLRQLLAERLTLISANWWRDRVSADVYNEANSRKAQDESPWPWMEGKQYPAHYYMSFADYSKVISRRDNWREAFENVFRDPEWVRVVFRELEHTRNDVAHNRDLTERQLTALRLYSGDITRAISGAPPNTSIAATPSHTLEETLSV